MQKILMIIGARPNYMKACPIYLKLRNNYEIFLIHTGQHSDLSMNNVFMSQLGLPNLYRQYELLNRDTKIGIYDEILYNGEITLECLYSIPDKLINTDLHKLGQTGEIMKYLLSDIGEIKPDYVVVFGDVTSTLAGALAAKMSNTKLIHVEAGLRSFDMNMPEEINRIIVDHVSDILLITQKSGLENLMKEHIKGNMFIIENPMIECFKLFEKNVLENNIHERYDLKKKEYMVVTLHRPSNVDDLCGLKKICEELNTIGRTHTVIFPVHPRTKNNIEKLNTEYHNIKFIQPLDYINFLSLISNSICVISDSGGIQEETSYLRIPCFTYRKNTERPDTLIQNGGTNRLIDTISLKILEYISA